jgi:hypothetical protein
VDWSWPVLATGKQGQDVKALVLLSPQYQVERGRLNMARPLENPVQSRFSISIVYGGEKAPPAAVRDARRIETSLKRWHKEQDQEKEQTLFVDPLETSLQGTKLLTAPGVRIQELIAAFIQIRLVEKDSTWRERTGPLN